MRPQRSGTSGQGLVVIRTIGLLLVLALVVVGVAIGVGRINPESSLSTPDTAMLHDITGIDPGESIVLSLPQLEVSVDVPENAWSEEGYLSLTAREAGPYQDAEVADGWFRTKVVDVAFYNASGKLVKDHVLENILDVCFSVSDDSWSMYFEDETCFVVQYYNMDKTSPRWVSLPTYGRVNGRQICGQARHLTMFALATKSQIEPLLPVTGPLYEEP